MNTESILRTATEVLTTMGLKVLGAIVVWLIGRWLIGLATRLLSTAMGREKVDPTLIRYVVSATNAALTIILVVAILGYFGVETTSFAALIAGAGLAIGAAWAGLLSNFAAGAFLLILRPFKVGDFIKAAGVEGTVTELGLFATTIHTPDNVTTYVGNNKIFSDNISNYSLSQCRRVDRLAQLTHGVDPQDATKRLKDAIAAIPNVAKNPAPEVEIIDFNTIGPVLSVRPYAHNDHYWQVFYDTNKAIIETFAAAGYAPPDAPAVPAA